MASLKSDIINQLLQTRLSATRESLSSAEASLQESRADGAVMQRKLEATAAEAERLKCEVADLSGTAAASAAATAKRSEALQKMVSSRSYRVTILCGKQTSG